jgi:hypothetical protein
METNADMMPHYTYDDLSAKLIDVLPELKERVDSLFREWGPDRPGQHVVYGDLLNPYVMALLDLGGPDETLQRIFAFLEELSNHPEERVQEVVGVTVCEALVNRGYLTKAWPYMGKGTRRMVLEIVMWQPQPGAGDEYTNADLAQYDQSWRKQVEELGGPDRVFVADVYRIRGDLIEKLRLRRPARSDPDPYRGVDDARYRERFRQELEKLGGPLKVYAPDVLTIRENLFQEFGLPR